MGDKKKKVKAAEIAEEGEVKNEMKKKKKGARRRLKKLLL